MRYVRALQTEVNKKMHCVVKFPAREQMTPLPALGRRRRLRGTMLR
jgi:hypothetical protein